jgi:hypothetical protein
MNEKEREIVYDSIKKHGDSFWNTGDDDDWNGYLVEDIEEYLKKEGFELAVRPIEQPVYADGKGE